MILQLRDQDDANLRSTSCKYPLKAKPEAHVKAVLGKSNFIKLNPEQLPKEVILCLDNDGQDLTKDKAVQTAIEHLEQHNKTVRLVLPKQPNSDFNDTLRNQSLDALKKELVELKQPKDLGLSLHALQEEKKSIDKDTLAMRQKLNRNQPHSSETLSQQNKSLQVQNSNLKQSEQKMQKQLTDTLRREQVENLAVKSPSIKVEQERER